MSGDDEVEAAFQAKRWRGAIRMLEEEVAALTVFVPPPRASQQANRELQEGERFLAQEFFGFVRLSTFQTHHVVFFWCHACFLTNTPSLPSPSLDLVVGDRESPEAQAGTEAEAAEPGANDHPRENDVTDGDKTTVAFRFGEGCGVESPQQIPAVMYKKRKKPSIEKMVLPGPACD